MFRNLCKSIKNVPPKSYSTSITSASVEPSTTSSRELKYPHQYLKPRQIWLESLDTIDDRKLGLLELHPEIFASDPRIDIIHQNVRWQQMYRFVSFAHTKNRMEVQGGGRKPWPQKGMGRARHGSIRSPLFKGGGVVHGPKSPNSYFYMLPYYSRVRGLLATLSIKFAQDDLRVVDSLEIPSEEPEYIKELVETRLWGPSVLFVDSTDIMPRNITAATDQIKHMNLMPAYGLNVYSMLKYETLVLTKSAVETIEDKLLISLHRNNVDWLTAKYQVNQV